MLAAMILAGAYLLGSIPFSYLVARWWGITDVRRVGSGNVGATNVMRSAGKLAGVLAFVLDFVKGLAAAVLGLRFGGSAGLAGLAAAAAVLGHMFPLWLGFKGGKGVATGAGAFLPLAPDASAAGMAAFATVLATSRYVSLGSIAGSITLAVTSFAFSHPKAVSWPAAGVALLVVWKHRSNLERIARGTENRLGRPRASPTE